MDRLALEDLTAFLAIPSVSTESEHAADMRAAADWLAQRLRRAGLAEVAVEETGGHPAVVGCHISAPGLPTVLFYGHYDVQPVDPLDEWVTPPFAPTVREGRIYARGASDDKGPVLLHVLALEECLAAGVPVNVILLIEGEEEIGSPHLAAFIERRRDLFAQADFVFISDTPMFARDVPSICTGLRGLASLELTVTGPDHDLHSGLFGGAVQNPLHALAALLASLHTPDGRVAVAGFYDDVREPSAEELESLRRLPFDERAFLAATGSPALFGEAGRSTLERIWTRPTLEVNGMGGGYQGEGGKTIVPARAFAKLSCRLVPDQDPERVLDRIERHIAEHTPAGVTVTVTRRGGEPASLVPLDLPAVALARQALREAFGREPAYIRMGGSIPVVGMFRRLLGLPSLLVGFGLPDENFHSPNEHFHLDNFERGRRTMAAFYRRLAQREPQEEVPAPAP